LLREAVADEVGGAAGGGRGQVAEGDDYVARSWVDAQFAVHARGAATVAERGDASLGFVHEAVGGFFTFNNLGVAGSEEVGVVCVEQFVVLDGGSEGEQIADG